MIGKLTQEAKKEKAGREEEWQKDRARPRGKSPGLGEMQGPGTCCVLPGLRDAAPGRRRATAVGQSDLGPCLHLGSGQGRDLARVLRNASALLSRATG